VRVLASGDHGHAKAVAVAVEEAADEGPIPAIHGASSSSLHTSDRHIPRNQAAEASAITALEISPERKRRSRASSRSAWPSFSARYNEIEVPVRRVPSRSKETTRMIE
jgi:hypothetical protein